MGKSVGELLKRLGWTTFVITGIWSFVLDLRIINAAAGFWGLVAAFFLAPVTFAAAPWYAGFNWGYWLPLILGYGGGIAAALLIGIGSALQGE